jgi:hypothetical protein
MPPRLRRRWGGVLLKHLQVGKDCRQTVVVHLKTLHRGVAVRHFGNESGVPPCTCLFSHVPANESQGEHQGFQWAPLEGISSRFVNAKFLVAAETRGRGLSQIVGPWCGATSTRALRQSNRPEWSGTPKILILGPG